ncbi:hypothetical protein PR202_ga00011 [Eleusine coracana subsp. coracana]|uniref:Uncharacterized protein n=1 Tax=Eleusine coracana subsp. coracana TaxID=191504 RepID=A0AAV5BC31_ELECO|nr:hypothetical protein PR202_ga00011 [Eleusine coracana subsp. coracana]
MSEIIVSDLIAVDGSPAVTLVLSLFFLILVAALVHHFSSAAGAWRKKGRDDRLPPSPPAMPVIGHLHLVSSRPHVSLRDLAARHGDEGLMLLRLGTVRTLVASSPRAAQAVLRTHDQSFASRPRSVVGDVLSWGPSDVGFAPYGERWRQSKKLVTTHLLSSKKVQSYRAAREEEVSAVISKIGRAAAAHTAVDMSELLSSFTSDVVCRAVAGRSYRAEGWNKVFPELIGAAMVLMGGFNLENFYPGPANVAGGVDVASALEGREAEAPLGHDF